jgi:hypothetical protein
VSIDDRKAPRQRRDDPEGQPIDAVIEGWWDWLTHQYRLRRDACTVIYRALTLLLVTSFGACTVDYAKSIWIKTRDTPEQHAKIRETQVAQQSTIDSLVKQEGSEDLRITDLERRMMRIENRMFANEPR